MLLATPRFTDRTDGIRALEIELSFYFCCVQDFKLMHVRREVIVYFIYFIVRNAEICLFLKEHETDLIIFNKSRMVYATMRMMLQNTANKLSTL